MTLREKTEKISHWLSGTIKRFADAPDGNFGILIGLAAIPLILALGGVVDYSNALREKTSVQSAADAAALAAAKYSGTDEAERTKQADRLFQVNLNPGITIQTAVLTKVNDAWLYKAKFSMPTAFLGLIYVDKLDMEVAATAKQGDVPLDIALVLDSTGSMRDYGKMDQLKSAVKLFLDNFSPASGVNNVQVAMIPFDTQIKISNMNMAMLATPAADCRYLSSPDKENCNKPPSDGFVLGTTGYDPQGYSWWSGGYVRYVYSTKDSPSKLLTVIRSLQTCYRSDYTNCSATYSPSVIYSRSYPATKVSGNFSGCIIDRFQPYDTLPNAANSSDTETLYTRSGNCSSSASLQPVVGLTKDFNKIDTAVNALSPSGNTNIAVGVQWGMEALTGDYPLQGKNADRKTKAIMIVLTDGDNTQDRWYTSSDSAAIDDRTTIACTNAKAMTNTDGTDLEIFTVRVIDGNESLLKSCATNDDHYFSVTNASQLTAVFQAIAERVKRIRIVS